MLYSVEIIILGFFLKQRKPVTIFQITDDNFGTAVKQNKYVMNVTQLSPYHTLE